MSSKEPIAAKVEKCADLLGRGSFFVPRYQRPYAWDEEQVNCLLEDIADCIKSRRPHHFLGTIMLVAAKGKNSDCEISDGQQRIITCLLICANLCRHFHESGNRAGETASLQLIFKLQKKHGYSLADAASLQPRALLSKTDNIAFQTILTGGSMRQGGKISAAWKTIDVFFSGEAWRSPETKQTFYDFLTTQVLIASIRFRDAVDSIAVFETLNARGKSLEQIHLVSAFLFTCLKEDPVLSEKIHECMDWLRTVLGSEDRLFAYTRCTALCRYGYLSAENFYRDFKRAVLAEKGSSLSTEAGEFAEKLADKSRLEVFRILTSRSSDINPLLDDVVRDAGQSRSGRNMNDYLQDLTQYKGISTPLTFALLGIYVSDKKKSAKFVHASAKLFASFIQRAAHSFTASFSPSRYERGVSELARDVTCRTCNTPNKFLQKLQDMDRQQDIIPDAAYVERMKNISFKSGIKRAKHILTRINQHQQKEFPTGRDITTEHILPGSSKHLPGWDFSEEQHAAWAHRLGNLTLLESRYADSSAGGNADFSTKKEAYKESGFDITRELAEKPKWDIKEIGKRQTWLAKQAARVWNFELEQAGR